MTPTPNRKHWSHDVQQLTGVPPRVNGLGRHHGDTAP